MISRRFATTLAVVGTLMFACGGLVRADDLRYKIQPSTGLIFEGRFVGGQLASERPVGQARMVKLGDGNYYWWAPPQLGIRPVPVRNNVAQPGPVGPAPVGPVPVGPAPGVVRAKPGASPAAARRMEQQAQEADRRAAEWEQRASEADSVAESVDSPGAKQQGHRLAEQDRRRAERERERANDLRMRASGVGDETVTESTSQPQLSPEEQTEDLNRLQSEVDALEKIARELEAGQP